MLLLHLSVLALVASASTTNLRTLQLRQFNANQDVSYSSSNGQSQGNVKSFENCDDDIDNLPNGAILCAFTGCRMTCDRGYQAEMKGRIYLFCDHSTGKLMYNGKPWRESVPRCVPKCGKQGCLNGGVCVAPKQCQCQPGFMGANCEKEDLFMLPGECDPPCENGGECIIDGVCNCPKYFSGLLCQYHHCDLPRKGLSNNDLAGNLSQLKIICKRGYKIWSRLSQLPIVCQNATWVIPRLGLMSENDVNCYPVCDPPCAVGSVCTEPDFCEPKI
ncbi:von Willebrand factor D and EGF domain-containing protein-like [Penaeus chinensis]|uniref:von Willebrand factor D and EGF domain-containing protein-like n=1 Tax=Penaeus chinensis TaxID=139456 RepID=UPI001FB5D71A|nr:von Willebrand factor D and EGF domain-containing protein-like [Penaeus chinensis]